MCAREHTQIRTLFNLCCCWCNYIPRVMVSACYRPCSPPAHWPPPPPLPPMGRSELQIMPPGKLTVTLICKPRCGAAARGVHTSLPPAAMFGGPVRTHDRIRRRLTKPEQMLGGGNGAVFAQMPCIPLNLTINYCADFDFIFYAKLTLTHTLANQRANQRQQPP